VLRGSSAGASSREFAGFGPVDGGVRGIFLVETFLVDVAVVRRAAMVLAGSSGILAA
jgi:hypothetical protein